VLRARLTNDVRGTAAEHGVKAWIACSGSRDRAFVRVPRKLPHQDVPRARTCGASAHDAEPRHVAAT
jgi:hypothetical protein